MSFETPTSGRSSTTVMPTVTGSPGPRFRRVIGPLALLAIAAVLAGCSSASGDRTSTTTTPSSGHPTPTTTVPARAPTSTSAQDAAKRAVLAGYRAYWDDVIAVGATADWRSPRLAAHATGPALAETRTFI